MPGFRKKLDWSVTAAGPSATCLARPSLPKNERHGHDCDSLLDDSFSAPQAAGVLLSRSVKSIIKEPARPWSWPQALCVRAFESKP